MSLNSIVRLKCFRSLENEVARHYGAVDLFNELETIAVDAPHGRQWVATGTCTIQRSRSNGTQSYTREACEELMELVSQGCEKASEDTRHAMGW